MELINMGKKKKLFGILTCDTIFSGDFSKDGKLHTIENAVRFISVLGIVIGTMKLNLWIIIPSIIGIGFNIRPKYMKPEYEYKLW